MAWTDQQKLAIGEKGKNLLVSAAAGSGKTAVMVERVCRMITEEGMDVRDLLVVTFTNAAASEMREKIRNALRKKAKQDPVMQKQLELLPQAEICTFHSFALDVIRRFFYLTDLEASFSIADEARSTVLAEEAMDELFEDRYEAEDPDFLEFMDWYSGEKNDDSVRELLMKLYKNMRAMPNPDDIFKDGPFDEHLETGLAGKVLEETKAELAESERDLDSAIGLLDDSGCVKLAEKLTGMREQILRAEDIEIPDFIGSALDGLSWPRMTASKDEKESYAEIKDIVTALRDSAKKRLEKLRKDFFSQSFAEAAEEIRMTRKPAETLHGLLKDFHARFHEKKQQSHLIDFSDIEHYCLDILKDEEASLYYRRKFKQIFIDEYQDTSFMQEMIIARITRDDNLFMVGDQKQCIYQFRLADPSIFRDKYARYSEDMQDPSGEIPHMKIDLNRNFRSKPSILNTVNRVFEPIMEGYDDDAKLYPGEDIPEAKPFAFEPVSIVVDREKGESEDREESQNEAQEEAPDNDSDSAAAIAAMKKADLEAMEAARIIRSCIGKPYYDSKAREVKHLEYRDIVILQRSVQSSARAYAEVMQQEGIPFYMDSSDGFFDRTEIHVFMNLLAVIDNTYQDVPMISVLRSEIFGFTTDELAEIRSLSHEGSFTEVMIGAAEGGFNAGKLPEGLEQKCREAVGKIRKWKVLSLAMPLADFLWRIMLDSGYYMMAGAMPDGEQRQANLRVLLSRAQQYSEDAQSSLYSFMRYIDAVRKNTVKTSQARLLSESDNVVRMMTIHKSKGLEFPVVIVAGMANQLTYTSGKDAILYHTGLGLGLSLQDPERRLRKSTLLRRLIVRRHKREEYEENIRILYVAMTRAKERLYLLGTYADANTAMMKKEAGLRSSSDFYGMLAEIPNARIVRASDIVLNESDAEEAAEATKSELSADEILSSAGNSDWSEVVSRLDYTYPFAASRAVRSKYTVTSLNEQRAAEEGFERLTSPLAGPEAGEDEPAAPLPIIDEAELARIEDELHAIEADYQGLPPSDGAAPAEGRPSEAGGKSSGQPKAAVHAARRLPLFMQEKKKLTFAERGTVYHSIMELIDFSEAEKGGLPYVERAVKEMSDRKVFLPEEIEAVDLSKISAFFDTEIGKRCARASERGELWKEQTFNLAVAMHGEKTIVQGIIDCFFREDGRIVLLDYKSNWVDERRPFEEERRRLIDKYSTQLKIYREALRQGMHQPVSAAYLYLFAADRCISLDE